MCEPTYRMDILNTADGCYVIRNRISVYQIRSGLKVVEKVR